MSLITRTYITPDDYKIAKQNGISNKNVYERVYHSGWTVERAITTPLGTKKVSRFDKWRDKAVVGIHTFNYRVSKLKWDEETAAMTPPLKRAK